MLSLRWTVNSKKYYYQKRLATMVLLMQKRVAKMSLLVREMPSEHAKLP